MVNQFAWGPEMNEKLPDSFDERWKWPMKDLRGKEIQLDWGWLYPSFREPENRHKKPVEEETQVASLEENTDISKDSEIPSNSSEKVESDNPRPNSEAPKEWEKSPEVENTQLEKFKENPNYPILERFQEVSGGKLTQRDFSSLWEVLEIWKTLDSETINKASFEDPQTQVYLENYVARVWELNKEPKKVESKWGQEMYALPEEFTWDRLLNKAEDPTIQLLLANYTRLPDRDGNPNFEKDIHSTFEVTANKIIEGKKFPRGEAFDIAMKDIGSTDIETQLQALSYIHSLVNTHEWVKGKKWDEKMALLGKHSLKKESYLQLKIEKLQVKIEEEQLKKNTKEVQKLEIELEKVQEEVWKWDVFEAGQQDIWPEQKETQKK